MAPDTGLLRVSALRRATSFRLALLFAGMFGTASLLFATTLYVMATRFLSGNPDERLRAEAQAFDSRPKHEALRVLDQHSVDDVAGRRPFGLFDPAGKWLGGNLLRLPDPRPASNTFFETQVGTDRGVTIYRSILHRMPNGNLLVVSRNIEELAKFRDELLEATFVGLGFMAILGIGGGVVVGVLSLRRLDNVTDAIERITGGDLGGRLPSRGTGDDLDRLVRVVNSMLDQIERLMGEVKGVCDSIAHDLRTPLTRLLAGLERAGRRQLSGEEMHAAIEVAIGEVQAMLRTFAALLRISEIEYGARRALFRPVDVAQIVEDVVEHYEPVADAKAIRLDYIRPDGERVVTIDGDGDLLFEAVANLLDNAVKFTPEGGGIVVRLDAGPKLTVSDTGCGIAPSDRETVRLRFHRGSRGQHVPGSGLGLPLVAAIAQLHGLDLRIEDATPGCLVSLSPASSVAEETSAH